MDNAPPNIPKRTHRYQQPEDNSSTSVTPDLRDSGISTASLSELTSALTNLSYEEYQPAMSQYNSESMDFNKTPDFNGSFGYSDPINPNNFKLDNFMNITPDNDAEVEDGPPPIPPKAGAMERSENGMIMSDGYIAPKMRVQENINV